MGHLLLSIVVLVWGPNFGITKSAYRDLNPILFAALRFTVCGILVLVATFWKERSLYIQKQDLLRVAVVGGAGIGLYQILWSYGLNLTTPSNSALIFSLSPLLVFVYGDLTRKESVERRQYLNVFLGLVGVALVILRPTAQLRFSLDTLPGDLLTLLACFCFVIFFSAWSKPLLRLYSPLRLTGYCMIMASIILWMIAFSPAKSTAWDQVGEKTWWALGYTILFSGMLGHVLWYEGILRFGVNKTMVYQYLMPVWAVLFNHLFMGERIFPQQIAGGAIILWAVHRVLWS
jgi:drug/metabolite transporter (DMT)-like permease